MATTIAQIEAGARQHLVEEDPKFWSSTELTSIIIRGIKDLHRPIVGLRQEYFLTIDTTNVSLAALTSTLTGVPSDVYKIKMIEPRDMSQDSTNRGLEFRPLDYSDPKFQAARASDPIDPASAIIYYAITAAGSPVAAPTIVVAPQVSTAVSLTLAYIPTVSSSLTTSSNVPIPGEVDNALIAWTVAYALAKESENKAPDPTWLNIYRDERNRILEGLGIRQYQEHEYIEAFCESEWP